MFAKHPLNIDVLIKSQCCILRKIVHASCLIRFSKTVEEAKFASVAIVAVEEGSAIIVKTRKRWFRKD